MCEKHPHSQSAQVCRVVCALCPPTAEGPHPSCGCRDQGGACALHTAVVAVVVKYLPKEIPNTEHMAYRLVRPKLWVARALCITSIIVVIKVVVVAEDHLVRRVLVLGEGVVPDKGREVEK